MRHPRLNSDAKLLLIYVQGLPETDGSKPLGEHAADLGMRPRAYHRAKVCLTECGYLHEWKWQSRRGHWVTEQLLSNVTLTCEQANGLRDGVPAGSPADGEPTTGFRSVRQPATQPVDKDGDKTSPHPPTKERPQRPEPAPAPEAAPEPERDPDPEPHPEPAAAPEPAADPERAAAPEAPSTPESPAAPEVVEAERVLLSLRHQNRDLLLGVREARGLAEAAAEWLRRGVSVADLRHALTAHLPRGGVRSAAGFLRHRLTEKLPAGPAPARTAVSEPAGTRVAELVTCDGPGNTHVFRPTADETFCGPCRTEEAWKAHARSFQPETGVAIPWRERVEAIVQALPS
ncbi:hypothetical protein [Streptomyces sp. P9-A4]|uniref:hypothetical protein n=1 Tax=Streptomyces sp. P9-A4 TaxID=3072285 RepID=UPI002FC671B0